MPIQRFRMQEFLRQERQDALDIATAAGPLLYGAGIDDSM